jgi:hypothetical protein
MQFRRAAHFITVGNWSDAIDVGDAELRSEFRTNQSVAREFRKNVDTYSESDISFFEYEPRLRAGLPYTRHDTLIA